MSIYTVTYCFFWETLYPPILRKAVHLAWGKVIMKPLQWLHNTIFISYANGATDLDYNNATAYALGDRVVYTDRGQYEAKQATTGNLPTDSDYWHKVNDNYIGARERAKYNSRKIVFEFALNKWFQTTGIYITNTSIGAQSFLMGGSGDTSSAMYNNSTNQQQFLTNSFTSNLSAFTIFVPLAKFNSLATNDTDRENIIRNVADVYVLAGMTYTVTTY